MINQIDPVISTLLDEMFKSNNPEKTLQERKDKGIKYITDDVINEINRRLYEIRKQNEGMTADELVINQMKAEIDKYTFIKYCFDAKYESDADYEHYLSVNRTPISFLMLPDEKKDIIEYESKMNSKFNRFIKLMGKIDKKTSKKLTNITLDKIIKEEFDNEGNKKYSGIYYSLKTRNYQEYFMELFKRLESLNGNDKSERNNQADEKDQRIKNYNAETIAICGVYLSLAGTISKTLTRKKQAEETINLLKVDYKISTILGRLNKAYSKNTNSIYTPLNIERAKKLLQRFPKAKEKLTTDNKEID